MNTPKRKIKEEVSVIVQSKAGIAENYCITEVSEIENREKYQIKKTEPRLYSLGKKAFGFLNNRGSAFPSFPSTRNSLMIHCRLASRLSKKPGFYYISLIAKLGSSASEAYFKREDKI